MERILEDILKEIKETNRLLKTMQLGNSSNNSSPLTEWKDKLKAELGGVGAGSNVGRGIPDTKALIEEARAKAIAAINSKVSE